MPLPHMPRSPSSSPFIWGMSFVVIKLGVSAPRRRCCSARLRFVFAALPADLLRAAPRRAVGAIVVGYGFFLGVAQFGLLFAALALGMPASLASLVMQAQVFFTILFAAMLMGERPGSHQIARWRSWRASACPDRLAAPRRAAGRCPS